MAAAHLGDVMEIFSSRTRVLWQQRRKSGKDIPGQLDKRVPCCDGFPGTWPGFRLPRSLSTHADSSSPAGPTTTYHSCSRHMLCCPRICASHSPVGHLQRRFLATNIFGETRLHLGAYTTASNHQRPTNFPPFCVSKSDQHTSVAGDPGVLNPASLFSVHGG